MGGQSDARHVSLEAMIASEDFQVTEAGMRACVETIFTMNQGMAELSNQFLAMQEQLIILAHEVDDLRQAFALAQ
jgi:hypothetical protein